MYTCSSALSAVQVAHVDCPGRPATAAPRRSAAPTRVVRIPTSERRKRGVGMTCGASVRSKDDSRQAAAVSETEEKPTGDTGDGDVNGSGKGKSDKYTTEMQQKMGGGLTYKHENGMNYAYVLPDIIVGSCPQSAEDVDRLADEGVGTIFCLQEDHDSRYFGFEISDIQAACEARTDIKHVRCPVGDFDPFSLRLNLPKAVSLVHTAQVSHPSKSVYIHCTAGLGRAPGTALAYMYWMRGFELMEAHKMLMEVRPCHPKLEAIRAATCDILYESGRTLCEIRVYRHNSCNNIQIAGLDVGWSDLLDMEYSSRDGCFLLRRSLLPGRYAYKFVWDGVWSYSADHPTYSDGDHTNNYLQVLGSTDADEQAARERITSPEGTTTPEERQAIVESVSGCSKL